MKDFPREKQHERLDISLLYHGVAKEIIPSLTIGVIKVNLHEWWTQEIELSEGRSSQCSGETDTPAVSSISTRGTGRGWAALSEG